MTVGWNVARELRDRAIGGRRPAPDAVGARIDSEEVARRRATSTSTRLLTHLRDRVVVRLLQVFVRIGKGLLCAVPGFRGCAAHLVEFLGRLGAYGLSSLTCRFASTPAPGRQLASTARSSSNMIVRPVCVPSSCKRTSAALLRGRNSSVGSIACIAKYYTHSPASLPPTSSCAGSRPARSGRTRFLDSGSPSIAPARRSTLPARTPSARAASRCPTDAQVGGETIPPPPAGSAPPRTRRCSSARWRGRARRVRSETAARQGGHILVRRALPPPDVDEHLQVSVKNRERLVGIRGAGRVKRPGFSRHRPSNGGARSPRPTADSEWIHLQRVLS